MNSGASGGPFEHRCEEHRENLSLLAAGLLEGDEKARAELAVLECSRCRGAFEAQREVFVAVSRGSAPAQPLDEEAVLARIRRRMALESRESLEPAPAALSRRGQVIWLVSLCAGALALLVLLGAALSPPPPAGRPRPAWEPAQRSVGVWQEQGLEGEGGAAGREVRMGEELLAAPGGGTLRLRQGGEVRVQAGGRLRVEGAAELRLVEGLLAVGLPAGAKPLWVRGRRGSAQTLGGQGVRFTLQVEPGALPGEHLAVGRGRVRWRGVVGTGLVVEAGQGSRLERGGQPVAAWRIDPEQAFAWVLEETSRQLSVSFEFLKPGRGVLAVANSGSRPARVARYRPLGDNYQLEIQRVGAPSAEFVKLNPLRMTRQLAEGRAEPVEAGKGWVLLAPGQRYELELDLTGLLEQGRIGAVAGHYQHFEGSAAAGGVLAGDEPGWGFALKSTLVSWPAGDGR